MFLFTKFDEGKTVQILGDKVTVNGIDKAVQWGDAKHGDCSGRILSVDPTVRGKAKLDAADMPVGAHVTVTGLKNADLDGKSATVRGWDPVQSRYLLKINGLSEEWPTKAENITVELENPSIDAPPPTDALNATATIVVVDCIVPRAALQSLKAIDAFIKERYLSGDLRGWDITALRQALIGLMDLDTNAQRLIAAKARLDPKKVDKDYTAGNKEYEAALAAGELNDTDLIEWVVRIRNHQQHHPDGRTMAKEEYVDAWKAAAAFIDHATLLYDAQRDELRAELRKTANASYAELIEEMKTLGCGLSYPYAQLSAATGSFSSSSRLGAGSQGTVHRGQLPSGTIVAIKRIEKVDQQVTDEILNEAKILSMLEHENIVPLIGSSSDGPEHCLVYELMEYGSLHDLLFDDSPVVRLGPADRFGILRDVAQGLSYMHSQALPIIHRDIKSGNILVDRGPVGLVGRIGDFGIARISPHSLATATHQLTTTVSGTTEYMAPEYLRSGEYSTKSDVYSLGCVMLEMITGTNALACQLVHPPNHNLHAHMHAHRPTDQDLD